MSFIVSVSVLDINQTPACTIDYHDWWITGGFMRIQANKLICFMLFNVKLENILLIQRRQITIANEGLRSFRPLLCAYGFELEWISIVTHLLCHDWISIVPHLL